MNPNSYTINKTSADGTFAIAENTKETTSTPLKPFVNSTGQSYWTAENVRVTETFNYAYPETQAWAFKSSSEYQNSVVDAVQTLYGGAAFGGDNGSFNLMATSTLNDGSAQKVAAENTPAAELDSGFHPLRNLATKVKGAIHHDTKEPGVTARGLDLESEIGKRKPLPFRVLVLSMEKCIGRPCCRTLVGLSQPTS